jgi:hypothetical protein
MCAPFDEGGESGVRDERTVLDCGRNPLRGSRSKWDVLRVRGESMARAVELVGEPTIVRKARVFTGDALAGDGVEASVIELALLLVSELVTNVVVHVRGTLRLTVHSDAHWVRIEVEDHGRDHPVLRPASQDELQGAA